MSENDLEFVERREASRLNLACPVIIRDPMEEYREKIRNISADGLKLQTNTRLAVNGKYGFEFILPRGPQIQLEGEVRWKKPKGDSALYGIYFSNIGVLARLRLTFFLHRTIVNIKKNMRGKGHEDA